MPRFTVRSLLSAMAAVAVVCCFAAYLLPAMVFAIGVAFILGAIAISVMLIAVLCTARFHLSPPVRPAASDDLPEDSN